MTKMKEISKMNDKDLSNFIIEKREEIRAFRFDHSARDVRAVRNARHDVARALTEQASRLRETAPAN